MFNPFCNNFWGLPCGLQICGPFGNVSLPTSGNTSALNTEVDQLIADMAAFGGSKTLSTTSAATDPNRVDQETITVPGA